MCKKRDCFSKSAPNGLSAARRARNERSPAFKTRPLISTHVLKRCAQRNVSPEELYYIIDHGRRIHSAGALFVDLRWCDLIPSPSIRRQRLEQLFGTTIVLDGPGTVVKTVYRNAEAPKANRCKAKYDRHKRAA